MALGVCKHHRRTASVTASALKSKAEKAGHICRDSARAISCFSPTSTPVMARDLPGTDDWMACNTMLGHGTAGHIRHRQRH